MAHTAAPAAEHGSHAHPSYVKVWAILLVLLCVSVAGPFLGIKVVTLITAFGIAIVKAFLVAKHFMHLNVQRPFVVYLLLVMLGAMVLFWGAVAPDVMKHDGRNWSNEAAKESVAKGLAAAEAQGAHGDGDGHH